MIWSVLGCLIWEACSSSFGQEATLALISCWPRVEERDVIQTATVRLSSTPLRGAPKTELQSFPSSAPRDILYFNQVKAENVSLNGRVLSLVTFLLRPSSS